MRFLMDFIMPPLKSAKCLEVSHSQNNNYFMSLPSTTGNEHILYSCQNYPPKVLKNLNQLRLNSRFCDLELIAGGKVFKVHRAVLAASSLYFQAMFTSGLCEKDQRSVELHDISPHTLQLLIGFIYTGEININQSNVQELIVAADMLALVEVVSGCTEFFIKELQAHNAIGIYGFAEAHNLKELSNASIHYIQSHFPQIINEDEIYDLPKEQIINFLSSEHLRVDSEYQVFQLAIRWITHNIVKRRQFVFEILKHVRLPLLSFSSLEKAIAECNDSSLRVALKSVHNDLVNQKGCLVPLSVKPRLCAKKDIFVIGGSKRELHSVWDSGAGCTYVPVQKFNTFQREWTSVPNMTVNKIVPGVATLNGKIYVVGGEQGSNLLDSCECYDPIENKLSKIANMVVPRSDFGLCALDGYLYAAGGWVGNSLGGSIERYDPKLDEWRLVGSLREARMGMGVVAYNGLIYMVGGRTENHRYLQDLLSYNPITGEWHDLARMSNARAHMGVAILDDYLYVVGGNINEDLNSVEKYSFKKNKWYTVPNMTYARSFPAVAAIDGLLYVIGGSQTDNRSRRTFFRIQCTLSSVECYNPLTNTWSECPPLPESRAEAGAVVM